MKKADLFNLLLLTGVVLLLFFPLFYTTYAYTDEVVQLWYYRKGADFQMFMPQGRYLTELLFKWLFPYIHTIREITWLRLFSLAGWILCIPAWYYILKKVVTREGLPGILAFFAMICLVTSPPFSIYVQWASCMEMFIANTAGLIAGYCAWWGLTGNQRRGGLYLLPFVLTILASMISLFTYQNGFGCFVLPFLLHLMAQRKTTRTLIAGIAIYLLMYGLYYVLFRLQLKAIYYEMPGRTALHFNLADKLFFFFTRPLNSAFHGPFLFYEKSIAGLLVYGILFGAWIMRSLLRPKTTRLPARLWYLVSVVGLCMLSYLPSLVVKENYSSNRTLLALNMGVFLLLAETLLGFIKTQPARKRVVAVFALVFVTAAWYNFHYRFLRPIQQEYEQVRTWIEKNYRDDIHTVFYIRPPEELFKEQYGITRSWDEFGVPSTFFDWTPDYLLKQVVLEKTGDREKAGNLTVKTWLGKEAFVQSGEKISNGILYIDGPEILALPAPPPGSTSR